MYVENWKVRLQEEIGRFSKGLFIYRKHGEKMEYMGKEGVSHLVEWGDVIEPVLSLEPEMLQTLFDELQSNGYKPKELGKVEGLYEAQSDHLADLRHLLKLPRLLITMERFIKK